MRDSESRSVFDEDLRREMKQKRRKKVGSSDASGDQGLFSEERVAYARRPKKDESAEDGPVKSSYAFREYDPTKKMGRTGHIDRLVCGRERRGTDQKIPMAEALYLGYDGSAHLVALSVWSDCETKRLEMNHDAKMAISRAIEDNEDNEGMADRSHPGGYRHILTNSNYDTNKTQLDEAPFGRADDDNGPGSEPPPHDRLRYVSAFMPSRRRSPAAVGKPSFPRFKVYYLPRRRVRFEPRPLDLRRRLLHDATAYWGSEVKASTPPISGIRGLVRAIRAPSLASSAYNMIEQTTRAEAASGPDGDDKGPVHAEPPAASGGRRKAELCLLSRRLSPDDVWQPDEPTDLRERNLPNATSYERSEDTLTNHRNPGNH
ncbi:hypothetical protein THAOC_32865 [Thalassiosira oceanica]|uniref:Uncharacterized protein n=1 Tax=Thalassiosira oceanica TaxID=159749 RepID=K0R534_THAOC|nr:hypothetical protein THAOC_32865 [Thalassiosira oceanica]|eukprot:EJK48348.1 hypothetical protein THAOC_32865 [Thalassiosira oceanica]